MDLYDKLKNKYPETFTDCFDFSPPDGWEPIVERLIDDLMFVDPTTKIVQVKEKFGELRVYASPMNEASYDLIDEAEKQCETICQRCGKPGEFRNRNGWYYVACEEHV